MTHPTFSHMALPLKVQEDMMEKGVWSADCPVSMNRLSLVQFSYHDFSGHIHYDGSVVVLDVVASHVENIFRHLFLQKFPVHMAKRMEHFEGDDDASMTHNNTSCFNFRAIAGTNVISMHAYGAAIDVNPQMNPCVCNPKDVMDKACRTMEVWPTEGTAYLNRTNQRPGMVEGIVELFAENGFREWGGHWNDMIDCHHFQLERPLAELLVVMSKAHGEAYFQAYVNNPEKYAVEPNTYMTYQEDPDAFMTGVGLLA